MKEYLRLGEIPTNESSYNFLTKGQENGVSVFEWDGNSPVLSNLQLVDSFSGRDDHKAYLVTGEEIGIGFDGEPLLKNVKIVKEINLDFMAITLDVLKANFSDVDGQLNILSNKMHRFSMAVLKNNKTGETKKDMAFNEDATWEIESNFWQYTYGGFEFSNPINGFNTEMGKQRNE